MAAEKFVQAIPLIQSSSYMGPPRYGVFADDDGNPYFEPLIALGMCTFNPEKLELRTLVGFTIADRIECAEIKAHFVGWESDPSYAQENGQSVQKWSEKCRNRRKAIIAAEQEKKQAKIIIPNEKGIVESIQVK